MKLLLISLSFALSLNIVVAQEYSLRVDSTYYENFLRFENGDSIYNSTYNAYSYDGEDQLVQYRRENFKTDYSYSGDTSIQVGSVYLEVDSTWLLASRTKVINKGNFVSELFLENRIDDKWVFQTKGSFEYDDFGNEISWRRYAYENDEWKLIFIRRHEYDEQNTFLEEVDSIIVNQDSAYINLLTNYTYDNNGNLVCIDRKRRNQGALLPNSKQFRYYTNSILDSIITNNYGANGLVITEYLEEHTYPQQNATVIKFYKKDNSQWLYEGDEVQYFSDQILLEEPDSIISYTYSATENSLILSRREYNSFRLLDDSIAYYNKTIHHYNFTSETWGKLSKREAWYHYNEVITDIVEMNKEAAVTIFPNPIKAGNQLSLKSDLTEAVQAVSFVDAMGQHILGYDISSSAIRVPNVPGIYNLLLLNQKNKILSTKKVVVVE